MVDLNDRLLGDLLASLEDEVTHANVHYVDHLRIVLLSLLRIEMTVWSGSSKMKGSGVTCSQR